MRAVLPVAGAVLIALCAGCAEASEWDVGEVLDALPQSVPETTAVESDSSTSPTTTSPSEGDCVDGEPVTASLRPDGEQLAGPGVTEIRERGVLRVGVDENTLGFAFRNPRSGDFEGFEIELAKEIAAGIFGDDTGHLHLVPVVTDEKIDVVEDGRVDMTISANSMTCDRWERVAFSSEYYTAHQKFLLRQDSDIETKADLAGATVCVTGGSSSEDLLEALVPKAELHPEPDRTGCLVALQEGDAVAYFGHDSFLYGMLKQDPTLKIRNLLPSEDTVSHYGIAISHEHPDLVRFVNGVLEKLRADRTWTSLHHQLEDKIDVPPAEPPKARYRD